MRRRAIGTAALVVLLLIAPASCGGDDGDEANGGTTGGVTVTDAWARPTPEAGANAAIYATVSNGTTDLRTLVSVDSDLCEEAQLHMTTTDDAGVASMQPVDEGIAVPPGTTVILGPGGLHVMCLATTRELAIGDTVTATFELDDGTSIEAPVEIREEPEQ